MVSGRLVFLGAAGRGRVAGRCGLMVWKAESACRVLFFAGALFWAAFSSAAGAAEIVGKRAFAGEVVVPEGQTWKVRAGAAIVFHGGRLLVRGRLLVEGTALRPVTISGDADFEGLEFRGARRSEVEGAVIEGGRLGARLVKSEVRFRRVRFVRNGVGLSVEQYGRAQVEECAFVLPARAGILIKRGGSARAAGTSFEGAGKAGVYAFGADDVRVEGCRFEGNVVGVQAAMRGAGPVVERSVFRRNGTALLVEKAAAPQVKGCEIAANEIGLRFSRRAEGTVAGCRIADNGEGVVVEYSSYPVFRKNVFRGNRRYAVRLAYQSAEWEEAVGDTDREFGEAGPFGPLPAGAGDFRPGPRGTVPGPPPKRKGSGFVDFRGNDFGDAAEEGGRPPGVHDGENEPTFEYGGKRYRMDRILAGKDPGSAAGGAP